MIKNLLIFTFLCLIIATCKKETIIIDTENIAAEELYGAWELTKGDTNLQLLTENILFEKSTSKYYNWYKNLNGFKGSYSMPFRATKNTIQVGYRSFKYFVTNTQLQLIENDSIYFYYKKNFNITKMPSDWIKKATILSIIKAPLIYVYRSVGIDDNYLYYCTQLNDSFVFKLNKKTKKIEDSMAINGSRCANFYYNNFLYHGNAEDEKLYKTSNFKIASKQFASKNIFNNVYSITLYPNTNDIYVLNGNNELYVGKENGDFNLLNLGIYFSALSYYKNNEFLISNNGNICKISNFKINENYEVDGYNITSVSSKGDEIWAIAENEKSLSYYLIQVELP